MRSSSTVDRKRLGTEICWSIERYKGHVDVPILHPDVPRVPRRPLVYRLVSSLRCRGTAISTHLRSLASPTIVASDAVSVPVAHDPCIQSSHAVYARWTGIGCPQLRGSCVARADCKWLRGRRQLQAGQEIAEV